MTGPSADRLALLVLLIALAAVGWVAVRQAPKLGVALFVLTVAFVPYWLGPTAVVYVPPACAVGALVLLARRPAGRGPGLALMDVGVLVLIFVSAAPFAIGAGTRATVFFVVAHWAVGYGVGRLSPHRVGLEWIHRLIAVIFTIVAVGMLAEFFLHWNPFIQLSRANPLYQTWGTLQERGGVVRAEWAFGHAIAAGACLALALPVTMASTFRPRLRAAMSVLMLAAAVVTFSRIGIVTALLGVVITICLVPGIPRRLRVTTAVGLALLGAGLFTQVARVFSDAGAEAANSAGYRLDLTALLPAMSPFGTSPSAHRDAGGALRFGSFRSIDSALLAMGLTYGALAMTIAIVLLSAGLVALVRGRATPAATSVVAQVPALLTVALITQYAIFLWFFIGLAVASDALRKAEEPAEGSSEHPVSPLPMASVLSGTSAGRSL